MLFWFQVGGAVARFGCVFYPLNIGIGGVGGKSQILFGFGHFLVFPKKKLTEVLRAAHYSADAKPCTPPFTFFSRGPTDDPHFNCPKPETRRGHGPGPRCFFFPGVRRAATNRNCPKPETRRGHPNKSRRLFQLRQQKHQKRETKKQDRKRYYVLIPPGSVPAPLLWRPVRRMINGAIDHPPDGDHPGRRDDPRGCTTASDPIIP